MSFREKRAWVSLFVMLVFALFYFGYLLTAYLHAEGQGPNVQALAYFALAALAFFLLVEMAIYWMMTRLSPKEARTPKDEREILIDLRASQLAYRLLMALSFIAAFIIVHHPPEYGLNWLMGNTVLCAMVIAQLVKFATQIYYHRRES